MLETKIISMLSVEDGLEPDEIEVDIEDNPLRKENRRRSVKFALESIRISRIRDVLTF